MQNIVFFAKVGRLASEELLLLKQKCLPILLYAVDVCNVDKRTVQSLDFTINRFLMKLFKTSNHGHCKLLSISGCELPSFFPHPFHLSCTITNRPS